MPPKISLNPAWPQYIGILSLVIALFAGVARYLFDVADPYYCNALVSRGTWLNPQKQNWQPDGCMLHSYTVKEGAYCLQSREVVFVGDSVTRRVFFQFAHILDPDLPTGPSSPDKKHQNHELMSANGTKISFQWDPFLNGTYITTALNGQHRGSKPPALLVLGSGLWYLRYASTSGGISAWEANMDHIFTGISTSRHSMADSIVMLPVEQVVTSKLSPERASLMHLPDIDAMNSDLFHRIHPPRIPLNSNSPYSQRVSAYLPLVFNKMLDPAYTEDGLHFSDQLVKFHASILLNLRCNDLLPKQFPFNKTCCNRYPTPNMVHAVLLAVFLLSIPALCYFGSSGDPRALIASPLNPTITPYLTMSVGLILVYLADRSWLWLKEHKQFNPWTFTFLCLAALACGCMSIRRADNDLGFLNRDQTDEWKGWMQIAILIYHYLGASKVSGIYNPIRVLVASYLFMTGYGHTTFYLRKADFGFLRIAQVLIRLNLLTILLAYVMNTDYISYYFSPLVSMWFIIIYITMAVGAKFNHRTPFLLAKMGVSAGLITWLVHEKWPVETLFSFLERVFNIRWSAREWIFRVGLDLWIVYVGMLASITVIKLREYRLTEDHRWTVVQRMVLGGSALAIVWFFGFELLQETKFTYNAWHPYISFIPVLAFIFLRNASVILRSGSSAVFAFVGKCSLETFVLQYHFWLAGDTKGVLLVIPGTQLRPINFVITSIMFIYLSDRMAWATGEITARICAQSSTPQPTLPLPNTVATAGPGRPIFDSEEPEDEAEGQELVVPRPEIHTLRQLKDQDGNPIPMEPDTPIRPRRWIDRLAEAKPAARKSEGALATKIVDFLKSLKGQLLLALLAMWLLNVLWSYP